MTSEVALLNKGAIALAADSATTVTYWVNNEQKTRYFKGANKIFNISKNHPVGIMTFASANLHGVPWELIIKAYRDYLGPKSHIATKQGEGFQALLRALGDGRDNLLSRVCRRHRVRRASRWSALPGSRT